MQVYKMHSTTTCITTKGIQATKVYMCDLGSHVMLCDARSHAKLCGLKAGDASELVSPLPRSEGKDCLVKEGGRGLHSCFLTTNAAVLAGLRGGRILAYCVMGKGSSVSCLPGTVTQGCISLSRCRQVSTFDQRWKSGRMRGCVCTSALVWDESKK